MAESRQTIEVTLWCSKFVLVPNTEYVLADRQSLVYVQGLEDADRLEAFSRENPDVSFESPSEWDKNFFLIYAVDGFIEMFIASGVHAT